MAEVYRVKLATLDDGGAGAERAATQFLLAGALERARRRGRGGRARRRADRGAPTGGAKTSARCWRGARARASRPSAANGRARPRRGSSWRAWRARRRGRTPICDGPPRSGTRASATRRGPRCCTRGCTWRRRPDAAVAMVLARLRILRGAASEAAHVLETTGRARGPAGAAQVALAARASEIDGESAETTIARWREAAEASGQRGALEALARAYRRARDPAALQVTYERLGTAPNVDARRGATYFAIAGSLALEADDPEAAEAAFNAARRSRSGRSAGACRTRHALPQARQVGRAGDGAQGDHRARALEGGAGAAAPPAGARRRRAPRRSEDGARALREGARAHARRRHDAARVRASPRRGAASGRARSSCASTRPRAPAGTRAAALLCEIGDIYEKRLTDDDSARRSYERALERDDKCMAALAALATLHRRHKRLPDLLEVLRRELKMAAERDRQLELHLEMARAADQATGGDLKAASAAYRDALQIDPANAAALSGLERLCRREGNWDVLAEALKRAPRSVRTVRALVRGARAPRAVGRARRGARGGAGAARRAEGDRARGARAGRPVRAAAERSRRGGARVASRRRGRSARSAGGARARAHLRGARALRRSGGGDRARAAARSARSSRRGASSCGSSSARSASRACRGRSRRPRRSRTRSRSIPATATRWRRWPRSTRRSSAATSSTACSIMRAQATTDPQQRASVLSQKGDLLERNGDLDGALAAYTESFKLDPASRTCFTAFERVCYRTGEVAAGDGAVRDGHPARRGAAVARLSSRRSVRAARAAAAAVSRAAGRGGGVVPARARARSRGRHGADGARAHLLGAVGLAGPDQRLRAARRAGARRHQARRDPAARGARRRRQAEGRGRGGAPVPAAALGRSDRRRGARRARAPLRAHARLGEAGRHPDDAAVADRRRRRGHRAVPAHRADVRRGAARRRPRHRGLSQDPRHRAVAQRGDRGARPPVRRHRALGRAGRGHAPADPHRQRPRAEGDPLLQVRLRHGVEVRQGRRRDPLLRRGDQDVAVVPAGGPRPARSVSPQGGLAARHPDARARGQAVDRGQGARRRLRAHRADLRRQARRSGSRHPVLRVGAHRRPRVPAGEPRAVRALLRARRVPARAADRRHPHAEGHARGRSRRALGVLSQARRRRREDRRPAAPPPRAWWWRSRSAPRTPRRSSCSCGLCQQAPEAYDFIATFRELEKLYRKRDSGGSLARVLVAQGSLREREYEIEAAEQIYLEALRLSPDEYTVVDALVSLHERLRRFDAGGGGARGVHRACQGRAQQVVGALSAWPRSSATAPWIRRAPPSRSRS